MTTNETKQQQQQQEDDDTPKMEYVRLGQTGLKVSRIALGCMSFGLPSWRNWVLDQEHSLPIIKAAWEKGINFFDTADMYSNGESEMILGCALKQFEIPRHQVVIATKVFFDTTDAANHPIKTGRHITANASGLSRKHIFEACHASLKRLQTSYIDLYQIHRWDNNTPIEETMRALHDLVQAGLVRYIGASTMYAWQFAKAQNIAKQNNWTMFVSMQNLYNLVYREEEREMIPMCRDMGVGLIPWSPLARGFLTGRSEATTRQQVEQDRLQDWFNDNAHQVLSVVKDIAQKRNISCAQVAMAWMYSKSYVAAPIIGVSKLSHLQEAISALEIKLTQEEIKQLETTYQTRSLLGWLQ